MTFKKAGLATLAATADAVTPRKYIKLLHHVYSTLEKHKQKLTLDVVKGLNELDKVVKEAAHTHSSAATGKLHYYLTEDVQVARLQSAAAALHKLISSTAKLSSYAAMDFKSSVIDAVNKLSSSKCALPANQLQLIEEFRNLTADLDPSADIPDGVHKAAEQVVRKVIDEVHGPFFNAEILDKELTHLEKAAQHLDPVTQHSEAACVKLLAGSLMLLDGNQGDDSDGDGDSLLEGSGGDPFSMPSFAAVLRVVDHDANKASSSSPNKLTIHLAGDDSATGANAASPMGSLTGGMDLPSPLASHSGAALSSPLGASQPHSQPASQQMQQLPKPAVKAAGAAGSSDETSTVSSSSNRPADMAAAAAAPHELLEDFMVSSSRSGITDGYKEARRACSFHAHMRLPREGVQKLAKFLETTPRVRGLSLAHNWIGPDGVQVQSDQYSRLMLGAALAIIIACCHGGCAQLPRLHTFYVSCF
eukprot:GHRR01028893.1.p1 GENE.GHRR01028893.1~~GHRR01028893.1.p1  ORF type:complete len:475 (+),score=166.38 GHRR01028893.1:281-1705(+)